MIAANFENDTYLGGGGDGWNLDWGSEIIHRHLLPIAKPGMKVLDLCCGTGRASLPLGLIGCEVSGVDMDPELLQIFLQNGETLGYTAKAIEYDVREIDTIFPFARFDIIILLDALVHQRKTDAKKILRIASTLLKKDGVIYVDGPSTEDFHFRAMSARNERVDDNTFMEMCGCTGVMQYEPFCFYHPGELPLLLTAQGLKPTLYLTDYMEYQTFKTVCIASK